MFFVLTYYSDYIDDYSDCHTIMGLQYIHGSKEISISPELWTFWRVSDEYLLGLFIIVNDNAIYTSLQIIQNYYHSECYNREVEVKIQSTVNLDMTGITLTKSTIFLLWYCYSDRFSKFLIWKIFSINKTLKEYFLKRKTFNYTT